MKKVVRLSESDLTKIVRRVLKEESENTFEKYKNEVHSIFNKHKKKLDDYFLYGKHEVLNMNGVKFFWNALSSDLESFMNNIDSEDKEKYFFKLEGLKSLCISEFAKLLEKNYWEPGVTLSYSDYSKS